ncbi:MAG TPA: alpha/beta fold hydrolase [Candidatus Limnocylindrales bacterium]|nr:alpha/beta fold hydrolase [Candidatus Limnocylindrales bacterium]
MEGNGHKGTGDDHGSLAEGLGNLTALDERPATKPIRKDERLIAERGLYVESWLPERRSRRKPLFMLHGELAGSWVWHRLLGHLAGRGWEGHALNLRGHYWSETADFAQLDFDTYVGDALAGVAAVSRPPIVVGHGMGGLLALKVAEQLPIAGLVLLSPALPAPLLPPPPAHVVRLLPRQFRRELIGWDGAPELIQRQNPDLSHADVVRIQHLMGVESGAARRSMLEGVPVSLAALPDVPRLVIGAGLDRQFPEADSERLAEWLGAEYQPFGAHSHFGLLAGENSHRQVVEAIRGFLEAHRL